MCIAPKIQIIDRKKSTIEWSFPLVASGIFHSWRVEFSTRCEWNFNSLLCVNQSEKDNKKFMLHCVFPPPKFK